MAHKANTSTMLSHTCNHQSLSPKSAAHVVETVKGSPILTDLLKLKKGKCLFLLSVLMELYFGYRFSYCLHFKEGIFNFICGRRVKSLCLCLGHTLKQVLKHFQIICIVFRVKKVCLSGHMFCSISMLR